MATDLEAVAEQVFVALAHDWDDRLDLLQR
jgi:hypothetical protein